jgi:hypothetical protein
MRCALPGMPHTTRMAPRLTTGTLGLPKTDDRCRLNAFDASLRATGDNRGQITTAAKSLAFIWWLATVDTTKNRTFS